MPVAINVNSDCIWTNEKGPIDQESQMDKMFGIAMSQVLVAKCQSPRTYMVWGAGKSSKILGSVPLCIPLPHLDSKIATQSQIDPLNTHDQRHDG